MASNIHPASNACSDFADLRFAVRPAVAGVWHKIGGLGFFIHGKPVLIFHGDFPSGLVRLPA
jgi:hypothetical protein